jgi:hypothetical protein
VGESLPRLLKGSRRKDLVDKTSEHDKVLNPAETRDEQKARKGSLGSD